MTGVSRRPGRIVTGILLSVTAAAPVAYAEVTPFYSRNLNPFIQIFGLPATENATLVSADTVETKLLLDIVNSSARNANATEQVVMDGETYRAAVVLRYLWRPGIEVGIDLPYVYHSSGTFDNFIEGWHDVFGLSNSEREQFESNRLDYTYTRDGAPPIAITRSKHGAGDIRLSGAIQLYRSAGPEPRRAVALRAGLKLPTGDPDRLLGSGATDVSLSVNAGDNRLFGHPDWTGFGALGVLMLGSSDVLPGLQRDVVLFGAAGIGWEATRIIDLKAQLDIHSSFYRSALENLGAGSIQLIVGGNIDLPGDTVLDVGVTENLFTDSTPDVAVHFLLRKVY